MDMIVVGSGPSGVSAAKALLARGRKVTMLDGGKTLETRHQSRRELMASTGPDEWSQSQRAAYQAPQFETPDGQARRYGSDFAMEPAQTTHGTHDSWFGLRSSRAAGGLSTLWGGAVLPYCAADMAGWPISVDDLAPHYRAVADFMPVAGRVDGLSDLFPELDMGAAQGVEIGPQAASLLDRLDRHRDRNRRDGIHIGAARQSVSAGCKSCGMCLHGCPWGLIYSAQDTLRDLISHPDFTYRPGALVKTFEENADGVSLRLGTGETLQGARVFIAAGVLETTRIILASDPVAGRVLTLRDSQHGFLPMLHSWRTPRPPDALPYTTMPQIFAELDAPQISPHLVHAQIYSWNEFYARDLIANYGFGLGIANPVLRSIASRLSVAQIFLHSDHSARIDLSLGEDGLLHPVLIRNPGTEITMIRARKALSRPMRRAGMLPLGFATRNGAAGSSFHNGATLGMSSQPGKDQSDILGRPKGLSRVHLVDSSVLPAIPATTITYSVMANAHRIATLAP